MNERIVVFLQNAWSPVYAGKEWPRRSWLRALAKSRSGQRLKILSANWERYHNASPLCGPDPTSALNPDRNHIESVISETKPDVIVACGRLAEEALREWWSGPLLCLPHPAHRVVTNELYAYARSLLENGFHERIAIRQKRGFAVEEALS